MSVRRLSAIRCKFADDSSSMDEKSNEFEKMSLAGGANCCKLEKADILELAVEHLRMLHQQQQQHQHEIDKRRDEVSVDEAALIDCSASTPDITSSVTPESPSNARYEAGFTDCLTEVERFVTRFERDKTGCDIIEHLASRLRKKTRRATSELVRVPPTIVPDELPERNRLQWNVDQPSVTTSGTNYWTGGWSNRYDVTTAKEARASGCAWTPEYSGCPTSGSSKSPRLIVGDNRTNEIVIRHQADSSSKNWIVQSDNGLNSAQLSLTIRNGFQVALCGLGLSQKQALLTEADRRCNRGDPTSDCQLISHHDGVDSANEVTPELVWRPW